MVVRRSDRGLRGHNLAFLLVQKKVSYDRECYIIEYGRQSATTGPITHRFEPGIQQNPL
jgi:hypothetical protein